MGKGDDNSEDSQASQPWWLADRKGRFVAPPQLPGGCPVVDTHTHLASLPDPAFAVAQAAATGLVLLVDVCDPTDDAERTYAQIDAWFDGAKELLARWGLDDVALPRYRLVVGIHPHNARLATAGRVHALLERVADPRTCAIGEIGLDYHYDFSPRDVQREVFAAQLELAGKVGLPVELHLREAHDDALAILREVGVPAAGCDIHCFTGSADEAHDYLELGCHIGLGGAITFKSADGLRQAVRVVPTERVLTETDAPYMAPVPLRGTEAAPAMVAVTLERLMEVRAVPASDRAAFCRQVAANAKRLLDRAPTPWQVEAAAERWDFRQEPGWVSGEDSAHMQADYERQQAQYHEREQAERERREQEKAARRAKQEADRARKERRHQERVAAGEARNAERMHVAAEAKELFAQAEAALRPQGASEGVGGESGPSTNQPVAGGGARPPRAVVLVGSPRRGITCQVADRCVAGLADAGVACVTYALSKHRVKPCIECDRCIRTGKNCFQTDAPGDDMGLLDALFDGADLLLLASPVFFAGPPSQLKAVFDRFQPRWARRYVHGDEARAKRPAYLLLTGTGGDPYGMDATVTIARSALAVAGFRIPQVAEFLLAGSESKGGHLPPLADPIADDARRLGGQMAYLARASQQGVWSMPLEPPEVQVHDWRAR